jgi:hypothetical protein
MSLTCVIEAMEERNVICHKVHVSMHRNSLHVSFLSTFILNIKCLCFVILEH